MRFDSLAFSSSSQSYRSLRHLRFHDQVPSCHNPIWLMNMFFCVDIENNLGKARFSGPDSHHLSFQKRIEFPLPTFRIIPCSKIDRIFEVSPSFVIIWDHVPFFAFLKFSEEAFSPLISYTDISRSFIDATRPYCILNFFSRRV